MKRNSLIVRSIAFSLFAKLTGSLTIFISLPLISSHVSVSEYGNFLTAMSFAAFVGLIFSPISTSTAREVALAVGSSCQSASLAWIANATFGAHFAAASLASGAILLLMVIGWDTTWLTLPVLIASALAILQGLFAWGDAFRLGQRADHVTSMFYAGSNIAMLGLLVFLSHFHLSGVLASIVYFGIPCLSSVLIFVSATWRYRIRPKPQIRLKVLSGQVGKASPMALVAIADYFRIYVCALLVKAVSEETEYAIYFTCVLLVARLINPLTLITRPLMPAYVDAYQKGDHLWLSRVHRIIIFGMILGAVTICILIWLIEHAYVSDAFRTSFGSISPNILALSALFLLGYGGSALLAPVFIGGNRAGLFAIVNLSAAAAAIVIGTPLAHYYGALGMLSCLAAFNIVASAYLVAILLRG